uniref:Ig-like domain-containing protein n=1 Tax=Biomphalaria glabrata TaxID=6526 RepID=A0A2C9LI85_BIOGL
MCPKAPVDMPVAWINESRVLVGPWLKDETGDRVSIDEHNSLHIKPLQPWDAGHYACIYGGRIRGRLRLGVKVKRPPSRVLLYAYYLLLTYPADLLVFLVLLCVRRKERSKVLNFDLLPEFEGSEESDEENDEKSDGSEEDESLESDES